MFVTGDDGVSPHIDRFEIWRQEFTGEMPGGCVSGILIGDFARPSGTANYSFHVEDTPLPGRAYQYVVYGMPGGTLGVFDSRKSWVSLTTGTALIAMGAWITSAGSQLQIHSCSCLALPYHPVASAPSEIVDSGVRSRLYGQIRPRDDALRFELVIESATPAGPCQDFAVEPTAWSGVKALYR
jgi:hypothetical protein